MLFCQSCHTTEKRPYHAHDSISQLKPSSEPCKATDSTHETANKSYHLPTMAGLSRTPVGKYGASSKKTNKTNKNKHKRNKHTQQERKILFELDTTQTWLLAVHLSNFQSNRGLFCLLSYPPLTTIYMTYPILHCSVCWERLSHHPSKSIFPAQGNKHVWIYWRGSRI